MTTYPGTLDTFTTKADTTDDVMAADMNGVQAAIVAIETELGVNPRGSSATVAARLAALATPSTPLTPSSLHATYGDHFTGASLDAKWSRQTYVIGDETYQAGGGSWLQIAPRSGGAYYYQSAALGTSFSIVARMMTISTTGTSFGISVMNSSGDGGAGAMFTSTSDSGLAMRITAGSFNTTFAYCASSGAGTVARAGTPVWMKLTNASGVFSFSYSLNGLFWSDAASVTPPGFTIARIGFGGFSGTATKAAIDFFDVQ
jgi:hypothetical protein